MTHAGYVPTERFIYRIALKLFTQNYVLLITKISTIISY